MTGNRDTVHSECIHTPSLYLHFVTLEPYSEMETKIKNPNLPKIPHNDKAKTDSKLSSGASCFH